MKNGPSSDARKTYLDAEREKWLTPGEVAYVLGVSSVMVRRQLKDGSLPYRGGGKNKRIHVEYLKSQPKEVRRAPDSVTSAAPVSRVPLHFDQTSRRLRAFDGGRPRRTATGA